MSESTTEVKNSESRDRLSRVEAGYETLDLEATKTAFAELHAALDSLADAVVHSLEQMAPHFAKMQSLLSQRGEDRKKVLKEAGLPSWTEYAKAFATKLDCSVRSIQRHIKELRDERAGTSPSSSSRIRKSDSKPTKLDVVDSEPDWKDILTHLMATLEQHGDRLPIDVINEMRAVQSLLGDEKADLNVYRRKATITSRQRYKVEHRGNTDKMYFAVVDEVEHRTFGTYESESEAGAVCESLNTSPVSSLDAPDLPQTKRPRTERVSGSSSAAS